MNNEEFDTTSNNIKFSVPFDYPTEAEQKEETGELVNVKLMILLNKLISYVLPSNNPRAALAAIAYASGMDLSYIFNCKNNEIAIAKVLGMPKQTFSNEVQAVRDIYNLDHSSTVKTNATKQAYENNYITPKLV
jgi:hypothetical protein